MVGLPLSVVYLGLNTKHHIALDFIVVAPASILFAHGWLACVLFDVSI